MAIEHLTMRERTYDALIEMIVNGQLEVGQPIDEVSLSKLLNVSRTPLREAIRQLVSEGLVDARPYRGYAIRSLSLREVDDLYRVRKELEVLAICEAVENLTDEDVGSLEVLLEQSVQALKDRNLIAYAEHDRRFHALIAELSGNTILIDTLNRIGLLVRLCRFIANHDEQLVERASHEREAMVDAFRKRDVESAGALMRAHISGVQHAVMAQLREAELSGASKSGKLIALSGGNT